MAEKSYEDKTEKATPKKRKDARKKGEVAKSRELPSFAVLVSSLITLSVFASYIYSHIKTIAGRSFSFTCVNSFNLQELLAFGREMIILFIKALGPLFAVVVLAAALSNIVQIGFMISAESIKPKLSKLNPVKGLERLFSKQSLMELLKALLKLGIVGGVGFFVLRGEIDNVSILGDMEVHSIVSYILSTVLKLSISCTAAMVVLIAVDYSFQKWSFEQKLKMSKKEIKDELKKTEGDPLIKSRIKGIQMKLARQRMMQEVPNADVVITNPTHLAVALKYDGLVMNAPKVLAKGAGETAMRIRKLAERHKIPVLENKELARSLYSIVEVGQEVPSALYQAVAEVLAYIYRLRTAS